MTTTSTTKGPLDPVVDASPAHIAGYGRGFFAPQSLSAGSVVRDGEHDCVVPAAVRIFETVVSMLSWYIKGDREESGFVDRGWSKRSCIESRCIVGAVDAYYLEDANFEYLISRCSLGDCPH